MKKAVLVGINYIRNPSIRLNGCLNDVDNTSKILMSKYGYTSNNITILRDDSKNNALLPTRANIIAALQKLVSESNKCSEIWFQYSGHGSQIRDTDRDEADRLDEVIVPMDYLQSGMISDDLVYFIVKNSACRTVLLFDSCHSGSMCDLQWSYEYRNKGFTYNKTSNKVITNPNVICLSGCKDSQTAADAFSKTQNKGVGAFTDSFLYCLAVEKYTASIIPLYSSIVKYITSNGFTQIPILSCSSPVPDYRFIPVSTNTKTPQTTTVTPSSKVNTVTPTSSTSQKEIVSDTTTSSTFVNRPVSMSANFYSHHEPTTKKFGNKTLKNNRIRMSLVLT